MSDEGERALKPGRKALLIGCIAMSMGIPTLSVVVVLLWHFAQIKTVDRAIPGVELHAVQAALQARYGGEAHLMC